MNSFAGELADVAIYLLRLADELGVDLSAAVEAKLARNARLPVLDRLTCCQDDRV